MIYAGCMKHILLLWGSLLAVSVLLFFFTLPDSYAAYGEAPTFAGSSTNAPSCGNTAPKTVWPFTATSMGNGTVDLTWGQMENVSSWTVGYGVAPGTYVYGISNFGNGDWRSLTVSDLPAGTYYFVIRGNNGCMPGPFSSEWKVVVGGGGSSFTGGQQSEFNVQAFAPQKLVPPGGTGYTPPTNGNSLAGIPFPTPTPFTSSTTGTPPWWQWIVDFFMGLFGQQ